MHNKEREIRDIRMAQAMEANLLGASGKFGVIAKYLGSKLFTHGGSYYNESRMEDPWDLGERDEFDPNIIHDASEYGEPSFYGWSYDGLSSGLHLEINYLEYDKELTVFWKGHVVFKEVHGELESYVPKPEWLTVIDRLYDVAYKRKLIVEKDRYEEEKIMAKNKALQFLDKMRLKWGF